MPEESKPPTPPRKPSNPPCEVDFGYVPPPPPPKQGSQKPPNNPPKKP